MWRDDVAGVPTTEALLDLLAEHDRVHPGVADAFWTTIASASTAIAPVSGVG